MFSKLTLRQQLASGFMILVAIIFVVVALAYMALSKGNSNLETYRELNIDRSVVQDMTISLMEMRISVINFLKEPSEANLKTIAGTVKQLNDKAGNTQQQLHRPEFTVAVEKIVTAISQYQDVFKQVEALFRQRSQQVAVMDNVGPQALKTLHNLLERSKQIDDREVGFLGALTLENLMQARLAANKFIKTNSAEDARQAKQALTDIQLRLTALSSRVSAENKALVQQSQQLTMEYEQAFVSLNEIINKRNLLIDGQLNQIGPKVLAELKSVADLIESEERDTGEQALAYNKKVEWEVIMLAVASVIIASSVTFFVSNLVIRPIGGEPRDIEAIVRRVAAGDFTLAKNHSSKPLTGIYASTMQMVEQLSGLIKQINAASDELTVAAQGLSQVTRQTADNSENQMHMLTQTATAMEEMTTTVQEITRSAHNAADAAREADHQAQLGQQVVATTGQNINKLVGNIRSVSEMITGLEQEAENVGGILGVIGGIAEQTNLLALNAAIEAARAGEQGRGFAVVADEVRTLASRTQDSTEEIQKKLSSLQNQTKRSVESMLKTTHEAEQTATAALETNSALENIIAAIGTINDMNHQIASSSEEQNLVAEQINRSVGDINLIAKGTAEEASDTVQSSNNLYELAKHLKQSCERFKVA
ncbi:methyl-accepting chemotaxis protein [Bowmanella denitrificans]|uniref:methyl-accepting chemotaxis protein n=1 Tax=Bowmanella denitrificans TaxID=366582 RepID=UPI000C9D18A4|nr:methyl-accepting chemotaxis protein [Bowmanella denitrificans]